MITTSRFLGYDKNEYGDLIVNRKEAEIVSLTFDLYLMNVGSSRIGELLDYLGVKTVVSQNKVPVSCTKTANYYISSIMMSLCTCL